jgi:hypothetical protein
MVITLPSADLIEEIDLYKKIELCGRVCYKSEDKITNDSSANFVLKVISSGHESVLEHSRIIVKLPYDFKFYLGQLSCFYGFKITSNIISCVVSGNVRTFRDIIKSFLLQKK